MSGTIDAGLQATCIIHKDLFFLAQNQLKSGTTNDDLSTLIGDLICEEECLQSKHTLLSVIKQISEAKKILQQDALKNRIGPQKKKLP